MANDVRSAHSSQTDSLAAARELTEQLSGVQPRVLIFFHSPNHDGRLIADELQARFPQAHLAGGSSCGEFSDHAWSAGGVTALALTDTNVERVASTLFSVEGDLEANVRNAMTELSQQLGSDVRELDPATHVGLLLVDSSRMKEEAVNEQLGNACPLLSFVGASVGDGMQFKRTLVHHAGETREGAAVVVMMKVRGSFHVLKACNFEATDTVFTVTRTDPARRAILELDGMPAAEVYGRAIGMDPAKVEVANSLFHPLGLMIEGKPWLRSVIRSEGGSLICACSVSEGLQLRLMRNLDIVDDTRRALEEATARLGKAPAAGLMFNCVARMVEVQIKQVEEPYYSAFKSFPVAGFHAHGESWLGHINQTLTGLLFA